ncbi:MAG: FHA domain-containing protein, partial [Pseudobdellovibrio sp.]
MSAAEKLDPSVQIKLKVLHGPHSGQSFHMTKSSFTIGRGPENEIVLLNDPQISRQHARIQIVNQDVEIINLSQKNKIFVGTESITKWKLVNDSTFKIGETEIQISFNLGKEVVQVQPNTFKVSDPNLPPIPSLKSQMSEKKPQVKQSALVKNNNLPKNRNGLPGERKQNQINPKIQERQFYNSGTQTANLQIPPKLNTVSQAQAASSGLLSNPKTRFYLIFGLALLGLVYWLNMPNAKPSAKREVQSTLKYEDEYSIRQNSVAEKELDQKRKNQYEQLKSPTELRVKENFQKGMRDYQLGNYSRALDFFQVVLNLDPNHALARRHMYLAKVRFDEIVKSKLILGESYYQKHNFKM